MFDRGGTDDIVLSDVPTPQFKLEAKRVTRIELDITLTHRSDHGEHCAISDVEFFTKS